MQRCSCCNGSRPGYVRVAVELGGVNVGYEWEPHEVCGGSGWVEGADERRQTDVNYTYRKYY